MVGSGVLAAVLSADARPSQGTQALRLALVATQTMRHCRAAALEGGLTRDYKRGYRATANASARRVRDVRPADDRRHRRLGLRGRPQARPVEREPRLHERAGLGERRLELHWRSLDGGRTFKWVPGAAPLGGKVTTCHGGGDTELAVDSAGRLYFNDLTLANFSVARSDDQGRTFTCSNTGVPDTIVDRQWYAIDGDPTTGGSMYLTNDEVGNGAVQCGNTTQNNTLVMYRSPAAGAGATAGLAFGPPNHITLPATCDEGIMGNSEVSPVATKTGSQRRRRWQRPSSTSTSSTTTAA